MPASVAMALAVSGLSPVIMMVRMPISRSWRNRSVMPSLTVSFRWMTPSTFGPSATTSGVPPEAAMLSTSGARSQGMSPPCSVTHRRIDSAAPLRIRRFSKPMPLIRVCAENGISWESPRPASSGSTKAYRASARSTIERPSGVSSAVLDHSAAEASSAWDTPSTGRNSAAIRFP
jgi:hypothetical protein